jgi:hypothetical protein
MDPSDATSRSDQPRIISFGLVTLRPELALKIRHQVAENKQAIADQFSIALSLERRRRRFARFRPTKGTP